MSLNVPPGEAHHWNEVINDIRERDGKMYGENNPPSVSNLALFLRDEACKMKEVCPNIWDTFEKLTRPQPHDMVFMSPSQEMSFGEKAAYAMGVDAVGIWLRSLAEQQITEEETQDV